MKKTVFLAAICGDIVSELVKSLESMNRHEVASQLDKVIVLSQMLSGRPEHFRFAAYPVPQLTYEERLAIQMRDWEKLHVPIRNGSITLGLDDFGQINVIYAKDLNGIYDILKAQKGYISTEEDLPPDLRERAETERLKEWESAKNQGLETGW